MKKRTILFSVFFTLMPSILALLLLIINYLFWAILKTDITILCIVLIYILTFVAIIFYFILRPCNFIFLLSGFLLCSSLVYLHDFIVGGFMQYLGTTLVLYYYTVPFVIVILIIYAILKKKT